MTKEIAPTKQTAAKTIYAALRILKDSGGSMKGSDLLDNMKQNLTFSEWEEGIYPSTGTPRWITCFQFYTIDSVKAGFLQKSKGVWSITAEGEQALHLQPNELIEVAGKKYGEWKKQHDIEKAASASISTDEAEMFSKHENIDDDTEVSEILDLEKKRLTPLNTILYGPPGTGKTYSTVDKACEILGYKLPIGIVDEVKLREDKRRFFRSHVGNQVEFITFHQSLSYEDFIEGIKPKTAGEMKDQIVYETKPGLFTRISYRALRNIYHKYQESERRNKIPDFETMYRAFLEDIKEKSKQDPFQFITKSGSRIRYEDMYDNTTMLLYYEWNNSSTMTTAGTEPMRARKEKVKALYESGVSKEIQSLKDEVTPIVKYNEGMYYSVYRSFLDFIENKYSSVVEEASVIEGEDKKPELQDTEEYQKLLGQLSDLLEDKKIENVAADPFILIIDEINRGNVSQVFGELITLLEEDKRFGKKEGTKLSLSYSGNEFSVPPNLYIIGTMNTADRSVEALDTALRRRFSFEEKMPEESKLNVVEGLDLPKMLRAMNNRLEVILDRDHTIGHAWFMGCKNLEDVRDTFQDKIFPLLKEFFYNDYSKIGLIIGEAFFEPMKQVKPDKLFANFGLDGEIKRELASKKIYKLRMPVPDKLLATFQSIYLSAVKEEANGEND
jgi:5-methylcytosine-specific restriction enzyme B